jgi:poly [ADP-ribose] polymerase
MEESRYSHKQMSNDSGNGSPVSKKRKGSERDKEEGEEDDDDDDEPPKKATKPNVVKVITKGKYPVEPESGYADGEIYIDEQGNAYTVMLNQTNIGFNNNKFYQIQLIKTRNGAYVVFQRWGRVGAKGQSKKDICSSIDKAKRLFESKFKSKTNNAWEDRHNFRSYPKKYTMIEVSYASDSEEEENVSSESRKEKKKKAEVIPSKLDPRVQDVIKLITDVSTMEATFKEFEIDIDRMPLGKLSKNQIHKGYKILKKIQMLLNGTSDEEDSDDENNAYTDLKSLSSRFYTLIPHSFGMKVPPLIDTAVKLKKKIDMLQTLSDMEIAQTLLQSTEAMLDKNPIDSAYSSLNTELVPLDKESEEYKMIHEYVKNTHASTHSNYTLELQDVLSVKRNGEEQKYSKYKDLHNKKLLWHGSRSTNFMGILSQGLRIAPPEAPATGYMFGKGVYFADMVSKSANYCFANNSNNIGFMLLSEVALGNTYELLHSDSSLPQTLPPKFNSTWGKGSTIPDPSMSKFIGDVEVPLGKPKKANVSGGSLLYNEFIVYDTAQINIKYLLKLKFNYIH